MDEQVNAKETAYPPMSLVCERCRNQVFTLDSFRAAWNATGFYGGFSYTTTWSDIMSAAELGCGWCRVLQDNGENSRRQVFCTVMMSFSEKNSSGCTPEGVAHLRLIINRLDICSFFIYTEVKDNPASRYIRARSPILDVASPHSCQQASACLEECILHHRDCPKPQLAQLPTRVIDCTDPGHPKLLITGSIRCSYAALSYVWGEKQPHCTTQKNLDTYLTSGINRNLLPKTIRDAIDSTHRFNIRYLWVDALCILQDSREDKDREIHQMRRIYEQAHVTLIAASAHMVSEGFLHDRPRVPPYSRLPFICPDNGQIGAMALSPVWKQYDDKQEPVNTRAWCLEERLLSSRAFIYASHTLQYHCQTHTINIGNNIHNPQDGRRLPRLVFSPTTPLPLSKEDLSRARVTWHNIVDNYTSRHVTKERDKLLALAGVVEKFHRVMGSGYIGGLWRSTLLRDLLWMKDYNAYAPRPGKYRAPSWSWAAVDGRVVYGDFDSRLDPDRSNIMQCHVLEYEVSLVNRDLPFGRICGSVLKVRSPLKRVTWNASAPLPKLYECAVQDEEGSPNHHQVDVVQKGELCCLGDALPDSLDEVLSPPGETWALPLLWNVEEAYVVGLVVAAASEHYFRRVGYFSSDNSIKDIA